MNSSWIIHEEFMGFSAIVHEHSWAKNIHELKVQGLFMNINVHQVHQKKRPYAKFIGFLESTIYNRMAFFSLGERFLSVHPSNLPKTITVAR